MISELEMVLRLVLAGFLAGVIGLERESRHRAAGLRTHILVSVGAALVMLVSIYGFGGPPTRDPARLAAQVVSGIGFLGAGTILREGITIRGLTTAASLWVVAGIGLGAGAGYYLGSVVTTFLAAATLLYLNGLERRVFPYRYEAYTVETIGRLGHAADFENRLTQAGVQVKKSGISYDSVADTSMTYITVLVPSGVSQGAVIDLLSASDGVKAVRMDE